MSIAWIIWIFWLPRENPWSGKTPKASELFLVAIPQSSCQAESGNKIMVSKHHPHALGIPWPCKWNSSSKAFKSPKSSQLQRKSSQSVLEFHEKMKGFTDHARGGSIASGFGTWGSASAPGSSGQHNAGSPNLLLLVKSKMSTPELLAKTRSTRNINSSQHNIHVRLVSWVQSPGSTRKPTLHQVKFLLRNAHREHRELDPPKRTKTNV